MYWLLKNMHMTLAAITITGFVARGILLLRGSPYLKHRAAKILPHIVDTLFLLTGIALVVVLRLPVTEQIWLISKLGALVVYILLGIVAFRFAKSRAQQALALLLGVLVFAYIVGAAINKSALSWLSRVLQ